jgi:RNAse (barnase) inhibitor barstar
VKTMNEHELVAYQLRQLVLLKKTLINYESNNISLNTLIDNIEILVNYLENLDSLWYEQMKSLWLDLEIIYAIRDSESRKDLNDVEIKKIVDTISALRQLVDDKIESMFTY